MEKPSLALIPTGYKDGKLYSVLPENGVGDFDVVRGSGATRVNKEGLVEDVRILSGELITNGDFSNGSTDWTLGIGWSVSDGKAVIDGTINSRLSQDAVTTIGKTYKYSFDVLDSGVGVIDGRFRNGGGVILSFSSEGTYTGTFVAYNTLADFTTLSGNTASFSIDNISVKEVTEDTNIPRLDYTGGGCPSLLLEPLSTNLITHSEDFSDASWSKSNCIIGSEAVSSPSGAIGVSSVTNTALFGRLGTIQNLNNGISYTYSFWCKNIDTTTPLSIYLNDSGIALDTFTPTSEWVRYQFTWVSSSTIAETIAIQDRIGTALGSYMIWGAQVESLSYATSYIPTSGAIATRLADKVSGAGDATTFNSTEGVLYVEMASLANSVEIQRLALSDGTNINRIYLQNSTTNNQIFVSVVSGGASSVNVSTTAYDITQFNKIAIKYKENDFALWINGTEVSTDTSVVTPIGLSEMAFDDGNGGLPFYGKVKDLRTYNTALTDLELIELTTI